MAIHTSNERIGEAGHYPFTRGIHEQMYRQRPWTMRQLAGFGSAKDTNERYKLLLKEGATGINGVFDYPTLRAFGSDETQAAPDVGRGGVAIDVLDDMRDLFADIDLSSVSTSIVSSQPIGTVPLLAMYLVEAERRGYARHELSGTTQNDFLMETAITIAPQALGPASSFRLECDVIEYSVQHLPKWNPVSITGYNYREAGADAVTEAALCLEHGRAIVEELTRRGIEPSRTLPRISFFLNAHSDFFEEVAKFRAIRRMWAQYVRDELGVTDARCQKFRFHTQTSGASNVARFAHVNIARSALQSLAAILGGTQSLHINGYDEAVSIPSEHAAMTALRTQYVLLHETGVASAVDPLGGSWFVESLTDDFEERTRERAAEIQGAGGIVEATTSGWVHSELAKQAYSLQREIDEQHRLIVGLNFLNEGIDEEPSLFELPTGTFENQQHRINEARSNRDESQAIDALNQLHDELKAGNNCMPATFNAVQGGCTVGEIGSTLRRTLGVWTPPLW